MGKMKKIVFGILILTVVVLLLQACTNRVKQVRPGTRLPKRQLAVMGYTIQVGAFANVDNAVRLTEKLKNQKFWMRPTLKPATAV